MQQDGYLKLCELPPKRRCLLTLVALAKNGPTPWHVRTAQWRQSEHSDLADGLKLVGKELAEGELSPPDDRRLRLLLDRMTFKVLVSQTALEAVPYMECGRHSATAIRISGGGVG